MSKFLENGEFEEEKKLNTPTEELKSNHLLV